MSKLEMEALKNSDEGRRMSKSQLQAGQTENQVAIGKVEEFKSDELGEVVRKLYPDVVRVKVRPSPHRPPRRRPGRLGQRRVVLRRTAALSQKYGIEIDAGWTVLGQVNNPAPTATPSPLPVGNKMEDAFEQIALLMNGAFRLANAPAFPAIPLTPIASSTARYGSALVASSGLWRQRYGVPAYSRAATSLISGKVSPPCALVRSKPASAPTA